MPPAYAGGTFTRVDIRSQNHAKDQITIRIGRMPLYEIAFGVAAVLLCALVLMQHTMQQEVHHARFGNQEINPWDVRYSTNLFGQCGTWKLHKRAYARSGVRSSFVTVCVALLVSVIVGIGDLLYVRYGP